MNTIGFNDIPLPNTSTDIHLPTQESTQQTRIKNYATDLPKVEKLTCFVCMRPVLLKSEKTSVNVGEK